ncbi:diguanylate cyclase [Anoxybacterium hadale]|uniref:Diguanylate cyclase n=1 Tax=Anoxybacterium hadale TaxID=3408580 RepID=A0ACD1AAY1_9FIRM|nr:diguanylate cyclase [Clostridiales bacterium]
MKRKIWFTFIIMAIMPTLLISYVMLQYVQTATIDSKMESLCRTSRMMEHRLTDYSNALRSDLQKKTKLSLVMQLIHESAEDTESLDLQERTQLRMRLLDDISFPVISGAIIDIKGNVLISTIPSEEGMNLRKTELYNEMISGRESYLGIVTINETSDILDYAVPIKAEDGKTIGILKQTLKMDPLQEYLDTLDINDNDYSFLIKKNGMLVFQYNKANSGMLYQDYRNKNTLDQLIKEFRSGQLKSESGEVNFEKEGDKYVGSYKTVDKLGCIAVASVKRDTVYSDIHKSKEIMVAIGLVVALLAISGGYYTSLVLTRPLKQISSCTKKMTDGDLTIRCSCSGNGEFQELCSGINSLADNLQKSERELRLSSRIDSLTHLPNRSAIYEVLDTLLYKNPNQALLMLDLDGYSDINENLGYEIGERVLMEVSDVLRLLPQHICYPSRLIGDTFLIFITNWTSAKYPEQIAERIIKEIEGIRFIDEIHIDISISIGIEYTNVEKIDKKKLIKHSSLAMQKSKTLGTNSYFIYNPYLQREM